MKLYMLINIVYSTSLYMSKYCIRNCASTLRPVTVRSPGIPGMNAAPHNKFEAVNFFSVLPSGK